MKNKKYDLDIYRESIKYFIRTFGEETWKEIILDTDIESLNKSIDLLTKRKKKLSTLKDNMINYIDLLNDFIIGNDSSYKNENDSDIICKKFEHIGELRKNIG